MGSSEAATTVADIVRRKLEQARHQLIERNLRYEAPRKLVRKRQFPPRTESFS
jgi:hypothetical protein